MLELTDGIEVTLAFLLAAALTAATVPAAIVLAGRTGFLDSPVGYKAHRSPTPYLGGAAVLVAAAVPILLFTDLGRYWPLLLGTVGLSAVGTVDDRFNLSPYLRVATEILAAWLLWAQGLGWSFLDSDLADFLLTAFWVTGIVNAFNLMDNLDGAAATVAAVCSAAIVALALIGHETALAIIAIALCGALLGFLRFNLARPARIFLGDGGSMAIGFLLAGCLMVVPMGGLSGWASPAVAAVVVGLPAFDTSMVVLSRRRRAAPVFSGATDHTTHRLLASLKTPRAVACALAAIQAALCGLAIEATRLGNDAALVLACFVILLGMGMIVAVDGPRWSPVSDDP
ncbi:MAG TPA: MraY family glycosyltransferase [Solirubrobacterales bacterium]|nr:MraY family glycosyltransferase [Solirubrobacterales bacterium]